MNSTTQMLKNNYKKLDLNNKENKVRGLYTIYNMNSTVQMADNNIFSHIFTHFYTFRHISKKFLHISSHFYTFLHISTHF